MNFLPFTLQNVDGYQLEAFSLDTDSIKNGKGMELTISESGETAFMLSERPVLVKAIPTDLTRESIFVCAGTCHFSRTIAQEQRPGHCGIAKRKSQPGSGKLGG